MLTIGHTLGDGFVSFHLVLMPLLAERLGFTMAAAGVVSGIARMTSAIGQPLLGHLCERRDQRRYLLVGLALTIVGSGLLGLSWDYWSVLAFMTVAMLGVAAYHPVGATLASHAAGSRRGTVMSAYASAGNFGVMLAPALLGFAVGAWGIGVTVWAIPIGAAILVPVALSLRSPAEQRAGGTALGDGPTRKGSFGKLVVHMTMRTAAITGFVTYLPFYFQRTLGFQERYVGLGLAFFTLSGVIGTFVAGHVSDTRSRKPILVWSTLISIPFMVGFLLTGGVLSMCLMAAGSAFLWAGHTVNVVLGQEMLPRNPSLASGITLGLTWGAGSLLLPAWGWIADVYGPWLSLLILAATFPALASLSALFLNDTEKPRKATA